VLPSLSNLSALSDMLFMCYQILSPFFNRAGPCNNSYLHDRWLAGEAETIVDEVT
jgi:hypothetical protein